MRSIISLPNRSAPPWKASTSACARSTSAAEGANASVTGLDLVGVDQALAVESEATPLLRFAAEAVAVLEIVENTVEHRNAGSARGEHDELERGRDRLAGRVERQPKVGA